MEPRFHPPGGSVITSVSAISTIASVTQAAPTNGIKRVVTAFSFRVASAIQLASGTVGCFVIDGATGTTTYLWREIIGITTTGAEMRMNGLNLIGTANTALTIEFDKAVTNAYQSVNLEWHSLSGEGD